MAAITKGDSNVSPFLFYKMGKRYYNKIEGLCYKGILWRGYGEYYRVQNI